MGKYTVTLNYLLKNNLPVWTFEDVVAAYFDDTYFTAEKWESLKKLFELKYLYEEIGNETIELWNHYVELTFVENIHTYIKNLKVLAEMEKLNPMQDYGEQVDQHVDNAVLPYSTTGITGNVSDWQESQQNRSGHNVSGIDMFENYYQKIRDLDDEFIDKFRINFMGVY